MSKKADVEIPNVMMVEDFLEKNQVEIANSPRMIGRIHFQRNLDLLNRQFNKVEDAYERGDIIGMLDALIDLQYSVTGSLLEFGFKGCMADAFKRVHEANMSKASLFLKGNSYKKPNLIDLVSRMQLKDTSKDEQTGYGKGHRPSTPKAADPDDQQGPPSGSAA